MNIKELKFNLQKKKDELHNLPLNTFILNETAQKLIEEINQIEEQIQVMEEKGDGK